ncbi:MAG: glycosyl hydrolase family 18 protein [Bacillota bacterium]
MIKFFLTNKSIPLSLILIMLLPILVTLLLSFNQVALADSESNNDQEDNWIKGILLIAISFLINNFINRDNEEPDDAAQLGDKPLVEENQESSGKEVLGFYVNWITPYANSYDALDDYSSNIDMVAPFWYTLNPDGSIENRYGGHQYEVTSLANNRNIEVLPLINNNQSNNMILVDPETREKAINNVVDLVENNDYDGVNIDFEYIPPWTRNGYTTFIKELSRKLKSNDKTVTISVFPKIDVSSDLHGAFDYEALAPHIDRMVIMTYDFNWSTGPPGPIAPIDWVEKNIKYALEYISKDKLILGIANYGYNWSKNGAGTDVSAKEALALAEQHDKEIQWDSSAQTPHFNYQTESEKREIWFEDSESLKYKLNLVEKYDIKGIGIWRLGNSEPEFWEVIEDKLR